jgi:hypothetical protein
VQQLPQLLLVRVLVPFSGWSVHEFQQLVQIYRERLPFVDIDTKLFGLVGLLGGQVYGTENRPRLAHCLVTGRRLHIDGMPDAAAVEKTHGTFLNGQDGLRKVK